MHVISGATIITFKQTMDFIQILKERGFVHQFTDEDGLRALLASGPQSAYIGFDCTAKSLHVGSLLQIMLLRWWQKSGHKPIVLLGGGTTKIGDPSGKDESRPPLSDEQIQSNMHSLQTVFAKFLDFGTGARDAIMVNNDDWLSTLNLAAFLRDYGKLFSVNRMLTMDSVKLRLARDQSLSFLEFTYMIMQAYDFAVLNKEKNCRLQMGGSDQWGNIIMGVELNRRLGQPEVFGATMHLITTASGAKMGKTASGAVWLNADLLSPYDYWQFWRNTEDGDVIRFLKLFTELPLEQIADYESWVGSAKINEAKIILATEATALLHGRAEADKAAKTAADTFAGSGVSTDLPELTLSAAELAESPLYALVTKAGFTASNGEARRLIKGNGVKVNDAPAADENHKFREADFAQGFVKLSAGKKRHVLLKIK